MRKRLGPPAAFLARGVRGFAAAAELARGVFLFESAVIERDQEYALFPRKRQIIV